MCTVSVIRWSPDGDPDGRAGGYRLISNRDEQRDRPDAIPPKRRLFQGVWPTDPTGGGTWVAAAPSGLGLTLLNVNIPDNGRPAPERSRGELIPKLLGSKGASRAMSRLRAIDLRPYAPFRLVAAEPGDGGPRVVDGRWDGLELDINDHPAGHAFRPICFVSSGLGDDFVQARLPLFDAMVGGESSPEAQRGFHHHTWPGRSDESVMMSRADARTVSVTTIEVAGPGARPRLDYEPIDQTR